MPRPQAYVASMVSQEPDIPEDREERRLQRQLDAIAREVPFMRRPLNAIRARGWWIVRAPVALLMIIGGLLSILPFLGLWMLPVGLLLLAIDLPLLRGPTSNLIIRSRRRYNLMRSRRARKRNRRKR